MRSCPPLLLDRLSTVVYGECCLESTLMVTDTELCRPMDDSYPCEEQLEATAKVMGEFRDDNLEQYWFCASKDGTLLTLLCSPIVFQVL